MDGIKKKINFFYDYIAQQRNEFTEFYNKYNNEPKEYNDINKKIKSNEREIMKIKEELENNFTDKKNVEYINKYNQYLKYYYDTINTLVELNLLNKELEKFNKFISDIENKVYDLMDKIINFIEEKSMINNLLDLLNDDQKKELTALLEKLKENEEKIKQNETKLLEDSKLVKYNVYEKSILQKIQDLKNNEFNNDEKKKLYDYLKDFYEKLITFDINDKIYNSIRQYINSEDKIIKIGHYLYDESEYIYPSQLLNLKQETDKKPHIEISFKENNTYINNSKTKKLKFTPNPDVIKEFKILDAPQELKNLNSINFT